MHGATGQVAPDKYSFWVDGQRLAGPDDTGGSSGPNGFVVGLYGNSMNSEHSTGQISEILIYNRAMTPDEMKQSTIAMMKKNNISITRYYNQG